jgi:hypothetical protein
MKFNIKVFKFLFINPYSNSALIRGFVLNSLKIKLRPKIVF